MVAIAPSLTQIRVAQQLLAGHFPASPIVTAPGLAQPGSALHLKLEIALPTGSFKPRGALCALTLNLQKRAIAEVVALVTTAPQWPGLRES